MEDVFKILKNLELELTKPSTRRNTERLGKLLADDFQEFGTSGKTYRKSEIIAALHEEPPTQIRCSNFKFNLLSSSSVLVTFRSSSEGTEANRSSIWIKNRNQWQLLHHQGTEHS